MEKILWAFLLLFGIANQIPIEKILYNEVFPKNDTGKVFLDENNSWFYVLARYKPEDQSSINTSEISKKSLVVWLNGGPGCSSLMGFFGGNGPYTLNEQDASITKNKFSWNLRANVQYLDQPVGVGFGDLDDTNFPVNDYYENAETFIIFIKKFLEIYPEFSGSDLYITGESFAGHFIPPIAEKVFEFVEKFSSSNYKPILNFKGISIGNGWIDPISHYLSYPEFAWRNKLITNSKKLLAYPATYLCISMQALRIFPQIALKICYEATNQVAGDPINWAFEDITVKRPPGSLINPKVRDWTSLQRLMNSRSLQNYLQESAAIKPKKWVRCSQKIRQKLTSPSGHWTVMDSIQRLLKRPNFKMYFYYGLDDFLCNIDGAQTWINKLLEASNTQKILKKPNDDKSWILSNRQVSIWGVKDAGHMVFLRKPEFGLIMLDSLMNDNQQADESLII